MTDTALEPGAARRELLARRLRAAARERAAAGRIVPRDPATTALPASYAQQRLWFLDQWAPQRATYTVPYRFRLTGALDAAALEAALSAVVDRHEVLRTTFTGVDGVPFQVVGERGGFRLAVTDLGALAPADRRREADRLALADATTPFDLATGPLVRGTLLRLGAREHLLLLTLHHTVSDGWSFRVLFEELNACYTAFARGEDPGLAPLELQYGDFAVWERHRVRDGALTADLEHWTAKLAGAPMAEFPTDHPRPRELSGRGRRLLFSWDGDLARQAVQHARSRGATLYMLLVAGLAGLMQRHNGVGEQVFGAAVAGRTRAETEGLIGLFVNTLALRIETGDDPTLETLVQRARSAAVEAFAHQDVPFDRLVEALRLPRETNRNPLFQVMISMQNLSHTPRAALHDVDVTIETVDLDIAKFDLTFLFTEGEDRIGLEVEYSTDLFREDTVRRLADRFERLLDAIVRQPELRLSEVQVLSDAERDHLFELSAPAPAELPEESVTAAFERWAAAAPDRPGASFDGRTLCYAELDAWANRLAHRLIAQGIGRGTRVGLCTPRTVELVVGMLAIARTGAAYVPLDPANPSERLAYMLADAEVGAVLYEPAVAAAVPAGTFLRVPLDAADDQPSDAPGVAVGPDDLLYVIYTSGSTGRPKGVCIPHRAVTALVQQADYVCLTPDDVIGQASNSSFDVATFEIWGALCNGALVVGVPKEVLLSGPALRNHIAEHRITVMNVPSSLLSVLAQETPDVFGGLDTLLFGGEAADPTAVAAVLRHPPGRMLNVYGPTETTTFSVAGLIRSVADGDQDVPLGRPIKHMWVYVLDADGALAPPGVTGELWIGGAGLAHGYWNRPELTAERFVEDPFRPGERLYRTGDLGRWRPDGELEFCGRIDDQVKIRGYRVEPGEIATVLAEHPDVRDAVVVVRSDAGAPARLVAYAVPSGPGVDAAGLRRFAAERLPEYMVPAAVLLLERLPLNANDKVDKAALPAPTGGEGGSVEYLAPRTGTESVLAEIWCEVLGCARVGARDDFFALGGHSLLVTQVVSRVESRLGVRMPLRAVFEAPVLERLAALVDERTTDGPEVREIVPVPRGGALPLSFAQQRLWFLDRLVPGSGSYNMPDAFRVRGQLDVTALQFAVDTVVARHESLRTTFTEQDGTPWQVIHPGLEVPVRVVEAADQEAALALAGAEAQEPFDLERGPLMRVLVIRLSADECWLSLTLHHIVSDGWSAGVLLDELSRAYTAALTGNTPDLPELPVQYADFAAWQRDWLRDDVLTEQQTYWSNALGGITPLELPLDRPRPPVQTHHGATLDFTVDPTTAEHLRTLARDGGATLFMCLLAAFSALLSRLSGQDDIAVGYPIANRNHPATERIIG
ncbi:amino acid adenylation domain-containing protein, partial [Kitasatospora sp. NPDC094015]|uniref:amino acid adenylation domain-containing protein n=1 Tax=Kitasatospora sp. NPDC094015 TaxID=3155205 RepID=UPI0033183776